MRILASWGVAMAIVLAVAACARDDAAPPGDEAQAVQIYEVPPGQLQSVRQALLEVLAINKTGSVSSSDGRLVVLAPARTQDSIAKAIEALSRRPADGGPANDAPVRLRFWLLEARAAAAAPDPRLEPLKPALDEATRGLGVQGYTLEGFTDVLASPGKLFESRAGNIIVEGHASRSASGVALDARIDMVQRAANWSGQLRTNVVLDGAEFLVLGTNADADGSLKLIVAQAQLPAGED